MPSYLGAVDQFFCSTIKGYELYPADERLARIARAIATDYYYCERAGDVIVAFAVFEPNFAARSVHVVWAAGPNGTLRRVYRHWRMKHPDFKATAYRGEKLVTYKLK